MFLKDKRETMILFSLQKKVHITMVGPMARVNGHPHCPHGKNPEIGNLYNFRILTPNLVSKVLY
jgi:hypothetical protein